MAKRRPQPAGTEIRASDAVIGQELGITNVMPVSSWSMWNGETKGLPKDTLQVGRDPLAPSSDELVFMLRRDGQAQAMLRLLTLPIRAAFAKGEWVMPENQKGGEAEVEFANQLWNLPPHAGGMSVPRSMFLNQTLLALAYGFSTFEIVRKIPESGPLAGKIVIDKLGYRDPRTITFLSDDHGNFEGFRQITSFGGRRIDVAIPRKDAWYWAANEEMNPMYGISYFEPAFQHYQMKRKLYYIGHIAAQMAAVPGRVGEVPLGASNRQISQFKQGIENFAFNTAMLVPPNFKVTPFQMNGNFDFIKIVDHHNMMMAASILAKFLQQEDRQVLIDNGKADASADMFVQLLEAITYDLSESWSNKLMPQFIDFNFASGVYPVHRFAPLTDSTKEAIMAVFTALATNSPVSPEFWRTTEKKIAERLNYDIDWDKVAKDEAAQQKLQEQAAEKAAQAQQTAAAPTPKPQGPNNGGKPAPASRPSPSGTAKPPTVSPRLPTALPEHKSLVAASVEHQDAVNRIFLALNDIIGVDDVPDWWQPQMDTEED